MTILWDGTQTSWDGTHPWGVTTLPANLQLLRDVFGSGVPWRRVCFEIWTVNPTTLAFETELPLRSRGGFRKISGRERMQRDELQFVLDDPTGRYLPGGDLYSHVDINSLVGVKWTTTTSFGSQVTYGNVYRIVDPPNRSRTNRGQSPLTVDAVDWLRDRLEETVFYNGFSTPLRDAIRLKDDMIAAGCPVIGTANSWATVCGAILYYLAGNRLQVTGDWPAPEHDATFVDDDTIYDPLAVAVLNRPVDWWTTFNWIAATFGRVQGVYDGDGVPRIRESKARYSSGLVISCDPDDGVLPIPWEHPLQRDIARPEFSLFQSWITYVTSGAAGPSVNLDFLAQVQSNAINNPYTPPASKDKIEVNSISQGSVVQYPLYEDAAAYAYETQHRVLSDADTLTVPCDSSFPASNYIRQDIIVNVPPDAIGEFTLMEIQQPLDERPSTLTMQWAAD